MWNKNEINGNVVQAADKAKLPTGATANNEDSKPEGQAEEITGEVGWTVGQIQRNPAEAITLVTKTKKP